MTTTRANKYTTRSTSTVYFSDFFTKFSSNAKSGQINQITNEDSVRQAIKNIVLTDQGERFFQPSLGGNIRRSLFEPLNDFTADDLKENISLLIHQNEERVSDLDVQIEAEPDKNAYNVSIFFTTKNNTTINQLDLTLVRVR